MLTNCRGVYTRKFILSAGQKPLLILVAKVSVSFPCKEDRGRGEQPARGALPRLASDLQFSCLGSPAAGITGVHHHVRLDNGLFFFFFLPTFLFLCGGRMEASALHV
uniref:Uncharacterized protein n=1 Tax=Sciurus vulgaris TaxID=55149 RepID=A0A8D2B908_SCIVU